MIQDVKGSSSVTLDYVAENGTNDVGATTYEAHGSATATLIPDGSNSGTVDLTISF